MKRILEGLGGVCFGVECYVLYCVGATCLDGQPFPYAARAAGGVLTGAAALAAVLAALWLCGRVFRRPRRLGIIRMDRDGSFYYAKK